MFYLGFTKTAGIASSMKSMLGRGGAKAIAPTVFKGNIGNKVVRDATSTAKTIASHSNVSAARLERGLQASKGPKNVIKPQGPVTPAPAAKALGGTPKAPAAPAPSQAKTLSQHAETAKNWIKANPLKSTGIGAGVGYMAGRSSSGGQQQQ